MEHIGMQRKGWRRCIRRYGMAFQNYQEAERVEEVI